MITQTCKNCGKEFDIYPEHAIATPSGYCSRACKATAEAQALNYTSIHEAMKALGIFQTILTTEETGQILGLVHNNGKPYSRRTLSNWLRDKRLKGARDLGGCWAIPIAALDPDRFTPPKRGRPSGDPTAEQEPSLRETLHDIIGELCIWTTTTPAEFPLDLDTDIWAKAWAVSTHPNADTWSIFDLVELVRDLFTWAIECGHYQPGDLDSREWYKLDQMLADLAPK